MVTGHTGFKGSWLALWLHELGAKVHGLSLPPPTSPSHFELAEVERVLTTHTLCDVRDEAAVLAAVQRAQPEVVLHLAAQPLVRESYATPVETFATNVLGTAHVLEAVRRHAPEAAVVVVTSDKCYEEGASRPYREGDPLGGHDPYSASKAAAEHVAASYRRAFGLRVATARAGNVIGGGDWAADRIVVDAVRALLAGEPVPVRNPHATRPFQHVLDPLHGYLLLAAGLVAGDAARFADAYNFGPLEHEETTVSALVSELVQAFGSGSVRDASQPGAVREAPRLALDATRASEVLGWRPRFGLREAVSRTARWYRAWHQGSPPREASLEDLRAFGSV